MQDARAQPKLLHTWIILVIVKQHLVQTNPVDGRAEHVSYILAAIKSLAEKNAGPGREGLHAHLRKKGWERQIQNQIRPEVLKMLDFRK